MSDHFSRPKRLFFSMFFPVKIAIARHHFKAFSLSAVGKSERFWLCMLLMEYAAAANVEDAVTADHQYPESDTRGEQARMRPRQAHVARVAVRALHLIQPQPQPQQHKQKATTLESQSSTQHFEE